MDVDADGLLDAVCLEGGKTVQPDFHRAAWRRNLGGNPPQFGEAQLIKEIDVSLCTAVSDYHIGDELGLMVPAQRVSGDLILSTPCGGRIAPVREARPS